MAQVAIPALPKPLMNGHSHHVDLSTPGLDTPLDSPMATEANTPNLINEAAQYVNLPNKVQPPEKFHRIDTIHLKKKLFEALGSNESGESEQARVYWQHLGQFVRGKLRREEFVELIAEVLETQYQVTLHNHLLTAILHNSVSTQPIATTPTLPITPNAQQPDISNDPTTTPKKTRPAGDIDPEDTSSTPSKNKRPRKADLELDISQVPDLLPKRTRVREWLGGLNRAERDRLKRLGGSGGSNGGGSGGVQENDHKSKIPGEMQRGYQGRGRLRQNSKPLRPNVLSSLHPLAQSTGYVPSQRQLRDRIVDLAKLNGMTEGVAEGMDDLLGAALDTHLDSLFCAALEVKVQKGKADDHNTTSEDDNNAMDVDGPTDIGMKPSAPTLSLPPPHPSSPRAAGINILKQDPTYELSHPDPIHLELQDFHSLFTLAPQIHPHLGSAVWQLQNGIALREEQLEEESERMNASWKAWAEEKQETDRSLEMLFQGQMVAANLQSALSGGVIRNAQAGPGPRSTAAAMSAVEADKSKTDGQGQGQGRDTPGPSVPSTPVPNQAAPNGLPNGSSAMPNGGGPGTESTARPGAPDRPLPSDLERIQLRPHAQPGPGGIILRPSRTLGLHLGGISGTNPLTASGTGSLFNSNSKDYEGYATGSNRKEMILRELEARKLYKVVDGRPVPVPMGGVGGMPPSMGIPMQMQAGGMGMPGGQGGGPGQAPMGHASAVPQDDATGTGPGPSAGLAPGSTATGLPALPLPLHGPNYWPYVDPASIFKDILG
ncbi:transcriptional regulator of RNA polII, SAGA, subunit-domain-containing protein [Filobasidium floriforme]|uniref:transcriptional regulator of RNA polII, SAGA, subunit-domain-containing protein n=1 Tax=Filobasidium floriforme TaxID=5210 RepID=UPI001E8DE1C1|nr:transcriptional regulator of RNA polII, SAGA, subunit-domain-containing protein [Filobasidium floriforme]KAH8079645.1 transcriptional regulator of RNA polII, SAGA, subunit-domain-containing protein [Filobasidium floriforme]